MPQQDIIVMDEIQLLELFGSIPRYSLTFGPSPIHSLPRILHELGGKVAIYAKREDYNSSLAYGGNQTRKLEYLVPEALSQSCDTLVSIGGFQSNHTRQVASVAAKLALKAKLVLEKWVDHDNAGYDKIGNIQLSRLMDADVRLDSSGFGIEHKETLKGLSDEVMAGGGNFKLLEKSGQSSPRKVFGIDAFAKPKETFDQVLRITKQTGVKIGY